VPFRLVHRPKHGCMVGLKLLQYAQEPKTFVVVASGLAALANSGYPGGVVHEVDPRPRNIQDAQSLVVVLVVEIEGRKDFLDWDFRRRREVNENLCERRWSIKCRGAVAGRRDSTGWVDNCDEGKAGEDGYQ
jgi:hypothetical protein